MPLTLSPPDKLSNVMLPPPLVERVPLLLSEPVEMLSCSVLVVALRSPTLLLMVTDRPAAEIQAIGYGKNVSIRREHRAAAQGHRIKSDVLVQRDAAAEDVRIINRSGGSVVRNYWIGGPMRCGRPVGG